MTAAQDDAQTRFEAAYKLAHEAFPTYQSDPQRIAAQKIDRRSGFVAGVIHAEKRFAPLLEAARAYRDAHAEISGATTADLAWERYFIARTGLWEAARTFEASDEGEAG